MSLLTIANAAQAELNLPISTTVIGNSSQTQKQLLALCNQEGKQLADEFAWQALITEASFLTTATETQTNATLPADFGWLVDETMFNRNTTLPVKGPINPREWQELKAIGATVSESRFRIRGNSLLFNPAPTAGHTVYYEYVSTRWCSDAGLTTPSSTWTLDSDVGLLPENVITLGLIWRWKHSKGLDYAQDFETYNMTKERAASRQGARRKLRLDGPTSPYASRASRGNIPEGSWT